MNIKQYIKVCLLAVFVCIGMASCDKMEDGYMEFTKGGEIVYIGRADSVKVYPGNGRIKLSWLLVSDPKITKCKVYWNEKADSMIVDVVRTKGVDLIEVMINNLAEQSYNFEVYTFDKDGRSSVRVETTGKVYGARYANTISNRTLKTAVFDLNKVNIEWYAAASDAISVEIEYIDKFGAVRTIMQVPVLNPNIPRDPASIPVLVSLPDFKKGNSFKYRTVYKPHPMAIDVFYTDYMTFTPI
jgi:hypothetical protein